MITIEYTETGEAISDFNYEHWLNNVKNNLDSNNVFKVSTSVPVYAVRLAIAKGEIDHTKVKFKYKDRESSVNKYGVVNYWPAGFADVIDILTSKIIETSIIKRKQK